MTANISRRRLIESSIVGTAALAGATSAFLRHADALL